MIIPSLGGMATVAAYDQYADWYDEFITGGTYIDRVHTALADLLGRGNDDTCLDICCGTGAHAAALADLGWTPVGVDLSLGQLRHGTRRLPVAAADATR